MARQTNQHDLSHILSAAKTWIQESLIADRSLFAIEKSLWTLELINEVYEAFVGHPDDGEDDFITKLKRQMQNASPLAQQLVAEMLWALILFPSRMKAGTKRHQVLELWSLSGEHLSPNVALLSDGALSGIGSGGPAFNNYRPYELEYLILLVRDIKKHDTQSRANILLNYEPFLAWIDSVPRDGNRQFRHMLRFFAFPDLVERISSNNDRASILDSFGMASKNETAKWTDRQLDHALLELRESLEKKYPNGILDFYESPLKEQWLGDQKVKTPEGEVSVSIPTEEDEKEETPPSAVQEKVERQSIQVQAKLARIGAVMGFKVWIANGDRVRVSQFLNPSERAALIQSLPLNYDKVTVDTIELIDVIWIKGRSIARAFEVEHTTAVYSGLLRMADLLALQPNMDIRLHIVAPAERRDKVFREMKRPVFTLLDRGPLSNSCTFMSYEDIEALNSLEHLAYTSDGIITKYEERAE